MPPRVSQQWHVWSFSRPAHYALCHGLRTAPAACTTLQRAHATKPPHKKSKQKAPSARNSAIIIPTSIAGIQPDHLIEHIRPIDKEAYHPDDIAVFFLTPAFATWLLDDQTFISKAVHRLYKDMLVDWPRSIDRVRALAAVVDKLPTPRGTNHGAPVQETTLEHTRIPPTADPGHEGLAYALLRQPKATRWSVRTSADEKGTISFHTFQNFQQKNTNDVHNVVRLPLAQTIFQTGTTTTMRSTEWKISDGAREFQLSGRKELIHQPFQVSSGKGEQLSALTTPLVPLTEPRLVDAGMGNILRRVIGPDQKSITASEELERVVPDFFKSRNEPAQSVSVWALLVPRDMLEYVQQETQRLLEKTRGSSELGPDVPHNDWHALWRSSPPMWKMVSYALTKGARLHRVLSGGGGWGKKAGLLSLDPVAEAGESGAPPGQAFEGLARDPEDISTALHEMVHPGDSIQFFIRPSVDQSETDEVNMRTEELETLSTQQTSWQWEFGTIPSTIDAMQASSWQHGAGEGNDVFVFRDIFGALTEGALTFERYLIKNKKTTTVGITKVDVPFSRFSSKSVGQKGPLEAGPEKHTLASSSSSFSSTTSSSSPFNTPATKRSIMTSARENGSTKDVRPPGRKANLPLIRKIYPPEAPKSNAPPARGTRSPMVVRKIGMSESKSELYSLYQIQKTVRSYASAVLRITNIIERRREGPRIRLTLSGSPEEPPMLREQTGDQEKAASSPNICRILQAIGTSDVSVPASRDTSDALGGVNDQEGLELDITASKNTPGRKWSRPGRRQATRNAPQRSGLSNPTIQNAPQGSRSSGPTIRQIPSDRHPQQLETPPAEKTLTTPIRTMRSRKALVRKISAEKEIESVPRLQTTHEADLPSIRKYTVSIPESRLAEESCKRIAKAIKMCRFAMHVILGTNNVPRLVFRRLKTTSRRKRPVSRLHSEGLRYHTSLSPVRARRILTIRARRPQGAVKLRNPRRIVSVRPRRYYPVHIRRLSIVDRRYWYGSRTADEDEVRGSRERLWRASEKREKKKELLEEVGRWLFGGDPGAPF